MMRNRVGLVAGVVLVLAMVAGGCSRADREAAPRSTSTTDQIGGSNTSTSTTLSPKRKRPSGLFSLSAFSSCASLLKHVKAEAVKVVTPYGLPGMFAGAGDVALDGGMAQRTSAETAASGAGGSGAKSAADSSSSSPPAFSGTNVQEQGVDEPDVIKSDGRRLVTLAKNKLQIADITGQAPRRLGSLDFAVDGHMPGELLVVGDRVVVFSTGYGGRAGPGVLEDRAVGGSAGSSKSSTWVGWSQSSMVRIVDISDPAKPKVVSTLTLEGQYVSARLVAGVVRMVVSSQPGQLWMGSPLTPGSVGEKEALETNKAAIERSKITDWMPEYRLEREGKDPVTELLAPCSAVLRPKDFSGLGTVSVLTLDPADPKPVSPSCVLGGGGVVYASTSNVFVATQRWMSQPMPGAAGSEAVSPPPTASMADTLLHQFAIPGAKPAEYIASGELPGTIVNQFSLSEHDGKLRVATTARRMNGTTESFVQVLQADDDGKLAVIGEVGGLGHEGETIQSVRFIGDRGYVVTFRQTDPLYVLDLSDPKHPKVTGELKIPGFSSYLHPLSEDVLIGIGQGPDERGGQGLQLSLFDVADPARPVRTANLVLPNTSSDAQHDHHAFTWWPATKQLVLPTMSYDYDRFGGGMPKMGASVFTVDVQGGFSPPRLVSHGKHFAGSNDEYQFSPIRRSMVVGSALLTLSEGGLQSSDLASLAEQGWLAW